MNNLKGKKIVVTWFGINTNSFGSSLFTLGQKVSIEDIRDKIQACNMQKIAIVSIVEVSPEIFDLNILAQDFNKERGWNVTHFDRKIH